MCWPPHRQPGPAPTSRGGGAGVQASGPRASVPGSGVGWVEGGSPSGGGMDSEGAGWTLGLQGWSAELDTAFQAWPTLPVCEPVSRCRDHAAPVGEAPSHLPGHSYMAYVCSQCLTFRKKSVCCVQTVVRVQGGERPAAVAARPRRMQGSWRHPVCPWLGVGPCGGAPAAPCGPDAAQAEPFRAAFSLRQTCASASLGLKTPGMSPPAFSGLQSHFT